MKNRELKFRAWDSELKCFGHGCRNQLTDRTDFILVISDNAIGFKKIDGSKADTALNFNKVSWREIENQDRYEIMQYTGLKDKNGKDELYQDDIVNVHYFYFDGTEAEAEMEGVLGWREFGLTLENIKGKNFESHTGYDESEGWIYLSNWSGLHEESFTILGNIHENPELLK